MAGLVDNKCLAAATHANFGNDEPDRPQADFGDDCAGDDLAAVSGHRHGYERFGTLVDLLDSLASTLPWMALFVALVTLVLLFLAFGSVLLPAKAMVMNGS